LDMGLLSLDCGLATDNCTRLEQARPFFLSPGHSTAEIWIY
jgi:hypothetical protein